ncbi:trehalase family glycosidase [Tengunoibacter tsumagoiensis]|uniref:Alpha,alpha-trehalase n=1 Tax=Tengunoibacter tsumagoiensis TaxID=2014871 RepID=A0A402A387_9CHLR|nr:trehalase family glycosidase [Tengunoibacter tsumagoiensis]GCE13496.1 hypothetical protein KTT_33550 [Tengunoibacter tsumagoiensis]
MEIVSFPPLTRQRWQALDEQIRSWWQNDLHTALEADLRHDDSQTLLFLPCPYSSAGGSEAMFPEMYAWDTYFINLALLAHKREDIVRFHILNYLFEIQRYGFMPNGNRTFYTTRSQTPVFSDSIWRYYQATGDRDLLHQAYPLLKQEYTHYWNAPHHQTPIGLATNQDLGDTSSRPELMSLAETGLDFCSLFGPDIRDCVPLITNCALVRYAQTLAHLADVLGEKAEQEHWLKEAETRAQLVRDYCWNPEKGFFLEYNYREQKQLPFLSLCAYWTLWAGIATPEQAAYLVAQLTAFEHAYGLTVTDVLYPSPFPEFEWVQWGYPAGWSPLHIILIEGLQAYGYQAEAQRIAEKYLNLQVSLYEQTGNLYEKYNVVQGNTQLPHERQDDVPPLHGWSSASVVLLGRMLFGHKDEEQ